MASSYHDSVHRWQRDPEGFWAEAAQDIDWFRPATKVFDPAAGVHGRWFAGATCNTCFNALDRHVIAGRGSQPAIIYDSPLAGIKRTFSYAELLDEVSTFAAVLQDFGAGRGDRVIIYMPTNPARPFVENRDAETAPAIAVRTADSQVCSFSDIICPPPYTRYSLPASAEPELQEGCRDDQGLCLVLQTGQFRYGHGVDTHVSRSGLRRPA